MPQPGTTSDLYMDQENSGSTLGAPPSAPAPVPPPVAPQPVVAAQPVVTKRRMADEAPDGTTRDTSTEALRPGNDLGYRNLDQEPKEPAAAAEPEKPAEAAPPAAVPEKLYAGKYKTAEELEKAYDESQKAMHRAFEEKAALERQKAAPPAPQIEAPKSPAQLALEEEDRNKFLTDFVANPQKVIQDYQQKAIQQTQVALAAQQVGNDWRKANPDLVGLTISDPDQGQVVTGEDFVAFLAQRLCTTNPELAKDPQTLISKATAHFRQIAGTLRSEGAKEALTQETRTIPLLQATTPPTASEHPSQSKAPLTSDDAYSLHMKMLKDQEKRSHRGIRP